MKNLLDQRTKEEILQRIDKLSPETKANWGKMDVKQNLRHMHDALLIPLNELDPTLINPPKVPKWLLKFFLLNVKPPKGKAETFKEINMVANTIHPEDFEQEKIALKKVVERFVASGSNFIPENKLAGKFSENDWGKLNFNHMDHHLRQFGV